MALRPICLWWAMWSAAPAGRWQSSFPMEAILDAAAPTPAGRSGWPSMSCRGATCWRWRAHGKTTTTSMLAWILECAGLEPGFLVGACRWILNCFCAPGRRHAPRARHRPLGSARCSSSRRTNTTPPFRQAQQIHYRPRTAVLNNLEFDHADIFDDLASIERQFHHLVRTVPPSGCVVVNGLEESLARVLHQGCWSGVRSFGVAVSDFFGPGRTWRLDVLQHGKASPAWNGASREPNQLNALAAIAAAHHVGVAPPWRRRRWPGSQNVRRRMELRGNGARHCGVRRFLPTTRPPCAPRSMACAAAWAKRHASWRFRAAQQHHEAGHHESPAALGSWKAPIWRSAIPPGWTGMPALLAPWHRAAGRRARPPRWTGCSRSAGRKPGDHIVCASNGAFGGVHERLLQALAAGSPEAFGIAKLPVR